VKFNEIEFFLLLDKANKNNFPILVSMELILRAKEDNYGRKQLLEEKS